MAAGSTVFYPSCIFHLRMLFDPRLHIVNVADPTNLELLTRYPPNGDDSPALIPLVHTVTARNTTFLANRQPKTCNVELPGYRRASTFRLSLDFKDLPIDPRTINAATIEIHLGAVSPEGFAAGMVSHIDNRIGRSIIPGKDEAGNINQDTLVFFGTVDQWKTDLDEGSSNVELEGRDLRGFLIDTPVSNSPVAQGSNQSTTTEQFLDAIDFSQDIASVVHDILGRHPMFAHVNVNVNPSEWPNQQLPSPNAQDLVPRHRRGARGRRAGGRGTPNASASAVSFWDLIINACFRVGAIPTFVGPELLIRPARSIFDQQRAGFDPGTQTPFLPDAPRQAADGSDFRVRQLFYGRDLKKLTFDRKFGGAHRPHTVRCNSVDSNSTERGLPRQISGRHPPVNAPAAHRRTQVSPSGEQAHEEILDVPCYGITSVERLTEMAVNIYEEIARGETGGTGETNNLASFGGTNADPDLLRLRPGHAITILTDTRQLISRAPLVSSYVNDARVPFETRVREMTAILGDENFARVIVATSRNEVAELVRDFRVSTVKYDYEASSGVKIAFEFQNYVFPSADSPTPSVGPAAGSVVRHTVPRNRRQHSREPDDAHAADGDNTAVVNLRDLSGLDGTGP